MENESWTIEMEAELEPLLPAFIENRWQDLEKLRAWIEESNFDDLNRLAHSLQGTPGAFGFIYLVELGREIKAASEENDLKTLSLISEKYEIFMRHHKVTVNGREIIPLQTVAAGVMEPDTSSDGTKESKGSPKAI